MAEEDIQKERILMGLPLEVQTAWAIVDMLLTRKGFEYWWDPDSCSGMPAECNDEIFEKLIGIIKDNNDERGDALMGR